MNEQVIKCEFLCGNENIGYINCGRHPYQKATMDKCEDIKDCYFKQLIKLRKELLNSQKLEQIRNKANDYYVEQILALTRQLEEAKATIDCLGSYIYNPDMLLSIIEQYLSNLSEKKEV